MYRKDFNLRHLRAFCEVARCQSISAASGHVHLSQPAITQALAKFEQTLSASLFVRKSNGMFLTDPGSLFFRRAERALDLIKTGARRAARSNSKRTPGAPSSFEHLLTSAQLGVLLPIAEAGNFSLAARTMGMSQPSLHRMARDLERLSGLILFDKTAQGIELTTAARTLMQFAELAFVKLNQGVEEINAWQGQDKARLAVGTLPLARSYILPTAINELTRLRPDVQVSVIDGPYDDLLHGLRHGQLDVLIGALRNPCSSTMSFKRSFSPTFSPSSGAATIPWRRGASCRSRNWRDGPGSCRGRRHRPDSTSISSFGKLASRRRRGLSSQVPSS
ncbi:MAG: LysR family transcriptional regulator [Geminicoccaceae bacterium]